MLAAALQVSICKDVCKMFAKTVEPLVSTPSTVCQEGLLQDFEYLSF